MYSIGMATAFVARHFLIGGDWGPENSEHSHYYRIEVELYGKGLDEHGYLVDFVDLEGHIEKTAAHYRDFLLNALPEFAGLNPSTEHLARFICRRLLSEVSAPNVMEIAVRVTEKDGVWASYREGRE